MLPAISRLARAAAVPAFVLFSATTAFAQDALAVVESYLTAWNSHDSTAAAAILADNVSYYDASHGAAVDGRDAAKTELIDAFINAAPDLVWTRDGDPVVAGNSVAFEWTFSGTNTGAWSDGTAATGKTFSLRGMSMFRVEGETIIYRGDHYDALGFYKQLGLM